MVRLANEKGEGFTRLRGASSASASDNRMPNSSGDFITSCGFLGLAGRGFRNFFLEKNRKRCLEDSHQVKDLPV